MKNKGKIILGIESTAHTFGVGVVRKSKVLSNIKRTYTTENGGIIPIDSAKHHQENKYEVYAEALDKAGINEKNIDAVAFSQGPGLAPCLLEGMKFAKELSLKLKKPIIPVNHCIAHLEIGRLTKAKDPVMLYVSGANTQIIAYTRNEDISGCSKVSKRAYARKFNQKLSCESGKYRIFGETLDIGVGNFIDNFARYAGIGFPGGPAIEKLAKSGKNYVELPYKVKGMDIALSGILTNLRQKIEKMNLHQHPKKLPAHLHSQIDKKQLIENSSDKIIWFSDNNLKTKGNNDTANDKNISLIDKKNNRAKGEVNYSLPDLCFSLQETVFAMLVECAERALAHTGKKELLLGGGVACNSRLQEMCRIMCNERRCKCFIPSNEFLTDNAAMIAYTGELMFKNGDFVEVKDIAKVDIKPRQRTDDVDVSWKK